MVTKVSTSKARSTLDEIIDHAAGLPLDAQDLLLTVAKAMKYTREYMSKHTPEPTCQSSKQTA